MNRSEQILFQVCEVGNVSKAEQALANGSCNVNATDSDGNTALMFAVQSQNIGLIRLLIDKEADVNIANSVGYCPLVVAVMGEMTDIVELLLKAGAVVDENNSWIKKSIRFADDQGFYAIKNMLEQAKHIGHGKIETKNMEERKQGLSDEGKEGVYQELFDACTENDLEEAKNILTAHGNWIDVNRKINHGQTALWNCIDDGERIEIIKLLLTSGADPNIYEDSGSSPFTLAFGDMYGGEVSLVKLFVEHGADVNAKDGAGLTALMYYSGRGDADMVKYLISKNASVYETSNIGLDALSIAERDNHKKVIKLLKKKH